MAVNYQFRGADGATIFTGSTDDLGQLVASQSVEVDSISVKVAVENLSDRAVGIAPFSQVALVLQQIGTGDGFTFMYTATDPNGTLSKPWGLALNAAGIPSGAPIAVDGGAGGVWAATGLYGLVVTATNAAGETIGSVEATLNVTDATRKWLVTWVQVPGATGYKVYLTSTPGTYVTPTLIATIGSGATTSLLYAGTTTTPPQAGVPPLVNTTGGAGPTYGTAPIVSAHDQSNKVIATAAGGGFAVGQQWFFWLLLRIPAGATSLGNKRTGRLIPVEA